jgi:predicted ribosomally synthesized peptide with SipW-like signal peptide
MSKRKILLVAAALCMIAILAVGGTLAYFTDTTEVKNNVFTVGNVQIELKEPNWVAQGEKDAPEVYPGEALAKDPTVTNTGANPCFVRVRVSGLDCLGTAPDMLIHVRNNYVVDALGADWVKHTDGYYYYTKVLAKDGVTSPVFDSIVIPTALTNGDGTEFSIDVFAQAVQAQGAKPSWTAVQTMTVDEIVAWFAACGL